MVLATADLTSLKPEPEALIGLTRQLSQQTAYYQELIEVVKTSSMLTAIFWTWINESYSGTAFLSFGYVSGMTCAGVQRAYSMGVSPTFMEKVTAT